jgi:hypothetical protein
MDFKHRCFRIVFGVAKSTRIEANTARVETLFAGPLHSLALKRKTAGSLDHFAPPWKAPDARSVHTIC